jgi:glycosyltransferase involved in cell wall biosynthesis
MPSVDSVLNPTARRPTAPAPLPPRTRIRVLLLADSCNPDWVSLPAVAFKAARAIADVADVVLVTNVRNEPAIAREGCGRARVVYIDNETVAAPLYRLGKFLRGGDSVSWTTNVALLYPSYLSFEWHVWRRFRAELQAGEFDVVHRLTPMSPTIPSPMAKWSPVPFVLGPLNGGLPWPAGYRRELRREREHLSFVRKAFRLLPYHVSTYADSRVILAAFRHTLDDLPAKSRRLALDFPEVGVDAALFHPPERERSGEKLTFLFAGRLVPYKCADVLIEAFARSPALRRHLLVIVGDGPEMPALAASVAHHGLAQCVELAGWKNQSEVAELMRSADVFAFPSIRELGAGVVIEAMACGCVPVVVDYGGPGGLVDDTSGVRVPLVPKPELVAGFTRALESLTTDRARLRRMGEAGARRALDSYTWEAKARKTVEVYEWALGRRAAPPRFADRSVPRPLDPRT